MSIPSTYKNPYEPRRILASELSAPIKRTFTDEICKADPEVRWVQGWKLMIMASGLALATLMVSLDATIIATAIPAITSTFDSLDQAGWYSSVYQVTVAVMQPICGRLYTYFDLKFVFLSGLVIVEIGSVTCALSTSSVMLIVGRFACGLGASTLFTGGILIIERSVSLRRRPFFIGAVTSMIGISAILGPLLGGILTYQLSWRWCFWINLPIGLPAFAIVYFCFNDYSSNKSDLGLIQKLLKLDIPSTFLLSGVVITLLFAIQGGGSIYPWSSPQIVGSFFGSAILLLALTWVQISRREDAIIPLSILKERTILTCCCYTFFFSAVLYVHAFYLPTYFQSILNISPRVSGIYSIAYLLTSTIVSFVVGGIISFSGHFNPFMWVGSVILTAGAIALYTLGETSTVPQIIGFQLLTGVGFGMASQLPFLAVQALPNPQYVTTGTSLVFFFNSLGGALALAVSQATFVNTLIDSLTSTNTFSGKAAKAFVAGTGASSWRQSTPADMTQPVLASYEKAIKVCFLLPIVAAAASLITCFFDSMGSTPCAKKEIEEV